MLPTRMSGVLWVQLLSPAAASTCLRQQNSNPDSQSHSMTLLTNGRTVNEGSAPHHNPVIASVALVQREISVQIM